MNNLLCTYELCRWALNVKSVRQTFKIRIIAIIGTADSQTTLRTQRAGNFMLCLHASNSVCNYNGSFGILIQPRAEENCRTDAMPRFQFLHFHKTTAPSKLFAYHFKERIIIILNFRNLQQVVQVLLPPHTLAVSDLSAILRN